MRLGVDHQHRVSGALEHLRVGVAGRAAAEGHDHRLGDDDVHGRRGQLTGARRYGRRDLLLDAADGSQPQLRVQRGSRLDERFAKLLRRAAVDEHRVEAQVRNFVARCTDEFERGVVRLDDRIAIDDEGRGLQTLDELTMRFGITRVG